MFIKSSLFRKKALDQISTPDQLTDYLRITRSVFWILLVAIFFLMAGLYAWSRVKEVDISRNAYIYIEEGQATVVLENYKNASIEEEMMVYTNDCSFSVLNVKTDDFGRTIGYATADLPDGKYEGYVVQRTTHPFEVLFGT